jgi:hypothetical protein
MKAIDHDYDEIAHTSERKASTKRYSRKIKLKTEI